MYLRRGFLHCLFVSLELNCEDNVHYVVNIGIIPRISLVNCPSVLIISLIPIYFNVILASFINKILFLFHFQEIF